MTGSDARTSGPTSSEGPISSVRCGMRRLAVFSGGGDGIAGGSIPKSGATRRGTSYRRSDERSSGRLEGQREVPDVDLVGGRDDDRRRDALAVDAGAVR